MTTEQLEDLEELARRAVACKRWRWIPGMRTSEGWRVIRNRTESSCMAYDENPENWQVADNYFQDGKIPDLSDPATLGCLLALVRKAHRDQEAHIVKLIHGFTGWQAWGSETYIAPKGSTEAEALVAALEAAP